MKEIRFSDHAKSKIDILANHGVTLVQEFIIDTIRKPDKIEKLPEQKIIYQRKLNENLVLRVVCREVSAFILVITLYPGKRSRCGGSGRLLTPRSADSRGFAECFSPGNSGKSARGDGGFYPSRRCL